QLNITHFDAAATGKDTQTADASEVVKNFVGKGTAKSRAGSGTSNAAKPRTRKAGAPNADRKTDGKNDKKTDKARAPARKKVRAKDKASKGKRKPSGPV
ncbi:MAG: hypothetical protein KDI36_20225, partial [Pseudomonadales bacterium]|nr:hypothetical protein [Pseudomonadales bacterium]